MLSNSIWVIADKLVRFAVLIFINAAVAKYLGPEMFGVVSYSQSFAVLFSFLNLFGLIGLVVKELVKKEYPIDLIISSTMIIKGIGGILAILLFHLVFFVSDNLVEKYYLYIVIFLIFNMFIMFDPFEYYFQSIEKNKFPVYSRFFSLFIISTLKILLVYHEYDLIYFVFVFAAEHFISIIFYVMFYVKSNSFKFQVSIPHITKMVKMSFPLLLSSIGVVIYQKIDQIMLGEMVGESEVGYYSISVKFTELWQFLPFAIVSAAYPRLIKYSESNKDLYYERLRFLFKTFFIISVLIALFTLLFSEYFIVLLFSDMYYPSIIILNIYIFTVLSDFWNAVVSRHLIINNLLMFSIIRQIGGASINIILNLIMIPIWQGKGAAIASVISYFFTSYILTYFYPPTVKLGKMMHQSIFQEWKVFGKSVAGIREGGF